MAWGINSESDALLALSNFHQQLIEWTRQANPRAHYDGIGGAGVTFYETVEEWRERVGDVPVAIALEKTRSRMDLTYLMLYYIARLESEIDIMQEEAGEEFKMWLEQFITEMLEEPEEPEEPEVTDEPDYDYEPEPEPGSDGEPEPERKRTREEIRRDYQKARRKLADQIRRREKAGVNVKYNLPDIPKNITEGSIRRLERIIAKVQDEYRYLPGRGYRGMKR